MAPTLLRSRVFIASFVTFVLLSLLTIRNPESVKHLPARIYDIPNAINELTGPHTRCPNFHAPASAIPPIAHAHQTCSSIPSNTPAFAIQLCHDPNLCNAFTLRIRRSDEALCERTENDVKEQKLSNDPVLDGYIKSTLGPDTFEILVDGAERLGMTVPTYEGGCRWRFDVQLRNAGPVYLKAWHLYEIYRGYNEVNQSWPELLRTPLFSQTTLSICSSTCTPYPASRLDPSSPSATYPATFPADYEAHKFYSQHFSNDDLPACSPSEHISGSYIPQHPLDVLYPPAPLPTSKFGGASEVTQPGHPIAGRHVFIPHGCRYTHTGQRFHDATLCTTSPTLASGPQKKKKKVLVIGDSHGRVIADGLVHRLLGERRIMDRSKKEGHKITTVGDIEIQFWWDPQGMDPDIIQCNPGEDAVQKETQWVDDGTGTGERKEIVVDKPGAGVRTPLHEFDAVVVSVSAHIMVSHPTEQYMNVLRHIFDTYNACAASTTSATSRRRPQARVYVPSPSIPNRMDRYPRENGDKRSAPRAAYYRDVSLALAREKGWRFVDQTRLTAGHGWEILMLDAAHYLGTDALDPILDEVLSKTGICDPTQRIRVELDRILAVE